jgi:hypothetical protein
MHVWHCSTALMRYNPPNISSRSMPLPPSEDSRCVKRRVLYGRQYLLRRKCTA